jgi:hypothetical protein
VSEFFFGFIVGVFVGALFVRVMQFWAWGQ